MTIDELAEYGIARMSDDEIAGFLSSQQVGVLGLGTDGAPSMRPLTFWFDGDASLYFLYVLGSSSRKDELSTEASVARFLVYRAETAFNWRSVLLTGTISAVPAAERDAVRDRMQTGRRPDAFERATAAEATRLYEFAVEDRVGFKHLGLPPGLQGESSEDQPG
jgi:hypothetical protein